MRAGSLWGPEKGLLPEELLPLGRDAPCPKIALVCALQRDYAHFPHLQVPPTVAVMLVIHQENLPCFPIPSALILRPHENHSISTA